MLRFIDRLLGLDGLRDFPAEMPYDTPARKALREAIEKGLCEKLEQDKA